MDADALAKLKADFLGAVSDLFDESMSVMAAPTGPRLVETEHEPSSICVFEWSKFASDPEGFYCGSKVGYASKNMSLTQTGPHKSMVCYDAMTESLTLYGDMVPERISIGNGAERGNVYRMVVGRPGVHVANMPRARFRELLVGVRAHHASHWQAVIDGFDHLPPPNGSTLKESAA